MTLDDEASGQNKTEKLKLVPGSYGMNVPSACTIVIIAGINMRQKIRQHKFSSPGKYLDKVDRVMTQVDRITEDIAHMPVAAFIFRNKESDEVHYSSNIRYLPLGLSNELKC